MAEEAEDLSMGAELRDGPGILPDVIVCALEDADRFTKIIYMDEEGSFEAFFVARRRGGFLVAMPVLAMDSEFLTSHAERLDRGEETGLFGPYRMCDITAVGVRGGILRSILTILIFDVTEDFSGSAIYWMSNRWLTCVLSDSRHGPTSRHCSAVSVPGSP